MQISISSRQVPLYLETLHYSYARLKPFAHARGYFSRTCTHAHHHRPATIHRALVPFPAARHYVLRRRDDPSRPHPCEVCVVAVRAVNQPCGLEGIIQSYRHYDRLGGVVDLQTSLRPKHEGTRSCPESTPSRVKIGSPHESTHA